MTFVILQPCCNDASCVDVCPVDCIHPTPDDPDFMKTNMLHIDPDNCIDCGACVEECPVDAIRPDHELTPAQDRYLEINAGYFENRPNKQSNYSSTAPSWKGTDFSGRRTAIVGSGPAAFYAAIELASVPGMEVDIFDRMLTPYGLVRGGVAPDHPGTKAVTDLFRLVAGKKTVRVRFGVDIGTDVSHEELAEHYDAVVYATGAPDDKGLGIPGEDLPGSHAAAEFVAWYNGNPEFANRSFDLSGERAVIVGNGNVALDIARVLTASPAELARTDIADHALAALQTSKIREVVVLGRRGPAQAAFTNPELIPLVDSVDVDIVASAADVDAAIDMESSNSESGNADAATRLTVELVRELASRQLPEPNEDHPKRRIVLRFCLSPVSISGDGSVSDIKLARNVLTFDSNGIAHAEPTEHEEMLETSLIIRSVGYRGRSITGVPFDSARGVIPNINGRVTDDSGVAIPGLYATGWIKRGPTGVIGTNKKCATETVHCLLEDIAADRLPAPPHDREHFEKLMTENVPDALDFSQWNKINKAEIAAGSTQGRPRVKLVEPDKLRAAATASLDDGS